MFVRQLDICLYIVNKVVKKDLKMTKICVKGTEFLSFKKSYPYILATCRPWIFKNINSVRSNNLSLKYKRFTTSGCKDIGIRTFQFVAKTQFLREIQGNCVGNLESLGSQSSAIKITISLASLLRHWFKEYRCEPDMQLYKLLVTGMEIQSRVPLKGVHGNVWWLN